MAFSYVSYTGDGSTTQYSISFTLGFLSRDDVHCYVDDVEVSFTWISDGLVQFDVAPANGTRVLIRRIVDKSALIHDYTDGAIVVEQNLDDSNKQALMAAHEMVDGFVSPDGGFSTDVSMHGYRITDLGTPLDSGDAVNKQYVDAISQWGSGGGTVESYVLTDGQTEITFVQDVTYGIFSISGDDADSGRIFRSSEYVVDFAANKITLVQSYPAGTTISMAYFDVVGSTDTTVLKVGTLDELRTSTIKQNSVVYVAGYSSAGDGGAGEFLWDSSDLTTEVAADTQSGIYVAPSSDLTGASGAWVRQDITVLNIAWFGDDIQAAIDFAAYSDIKTVVVNFGVYTISSTIIIPDTVTLKGAGGVRSNLKRFHTTGEISESLPTLKCASGFDGDVINFVDAYEASLEQLSIDATEQVGGHGVVIKEHTDTVTKLASGVYINTVMVNHPYGDCFHSEGNTVSNIAALRFIECSAYASRTGHGYQINSTDCMIYRSNAYKNKLSGIWQRGASGRFDNIDVYHNGSGIVIDGVQNWWNRISIDMNVGYGIKCNSAFNWFTNTMVDRNNVQSDDLPSDSEAYGDILTPGTVSEIYLSEGVIDFYFDTGFIGGYLPNSNAKYGIEKETYSLSSESGSIVLSNTTCVSTFNLVADFANDIADTDIIFNNCVYKNIVVSRKPYVVTGNVINSALSDIFEHAPVSTVAITNILGGVNGKKITILFTTGYSKVTLGGVIISSEGIVGNKILPVGTKMTAIYSDSLSAWVAEFSSPTTLQQATTTELTDITAAINTTSKYLGKIVLNSTTGVVVYAHGSSAWEHWYGMDGTSLYTPV